MANSPESPTPSETSEVQTQTEAKRALNAVTLPSLEMHAVIGRISDSKSKFPTVLDKQNWTPYLAAAARVSADTQFELGKRLGYYPEGLNINGVYTYSFEPGKSKAEALARGAIVSERIYKTRVMPRPEDLIPRMFAQSKQFRSLLVDLQPMAEGPLQAEGVDQHLAHLMFHALTKKEPTGPLKVLAISGLPDLIVDDAKDLHELQPTVDPDLPADTQAFSYLVTRFSNRVVDKGIFTGFPLVVSLKGCPPEVRRRHIAAQLLFADLSEPKVRTPILVSRDPRLGVTAANEEAQFHLELEGKLKDWWILKGIIEQRQSADWFADPDDFRTRLFLRLRPRREDGKEFDGENISSIRELFFQTHGTHSQLYVGDWLRMTPNDDDRKLPQEVKQGVLRLATTKLVRGTEILGNMIAPLPSIEYQLVIANYLSYFPLSRWDEAADMLAEYEMATGGKFKKFFRIPPLSRREGDDAPKLDAPVPEVSDIDLSQEEVEEES